jgi:hypothetical protein
MKVSLSFLAPLVLGLGWGLDWSKASDAVVADADHRELQSTAIGKLWFGGFE